MEKSDWSFDFVDLATLPFDLVNFPNLNFFGVSFCQSKLTLISFLVLYKGFELQTLVKYQFWSFFHLALRKQFLMFLVLKVHAWVVNIFSSMNFSIFWLQGKQTLIYFRECMS